jgi:hypothetical protein
LKATDHPTVKKNRSLAHAGGFDEHEAGMGWICSGLPDNGSERDP